MDLEKFFNEISPAEKKEKSVFFSLEQHLFYFITNEYEKHNKKNYIIVLYHTHMKTIFYYLYFLSLMILMLH